MKNLLVFAAVIMTSAIMLNARDAKPVQFTAGSYSNSGTTTNYASLIADESQVVNNTGEDIDTEPLHTGPGGKKYGVYLGPYLGVNGSINTVCSSFREVYPNMGFDLGASFMAPFTRLSKFGFMLDLGYSMQNMQSQTHDESSNDKVIESYGFFQINPTLYMSGFTLGLGIGFPLSAKSEGESGNKVSVLSYLDGSEGTYNSILYQIDDYSDFLKTRIDIRFGGIIKLFENESNVLNLNINASYNLNGLFDEPRFYKYAYENGEFDEGLNPTPASLTVSLSYMFKIGF